MEQHAIIQFSGQSSCEGSQRLASLQRLNDPWNALQLTLLVPLDIMEQNCAKTLSVSEINIGFNILVNNFTNFHKLCSFRLTIIFQMSCKNGARYFFYFSGLVLQEKISRSSDFVSWLSEVIGQETNPPYRKREMRIMAKPVW